MRVKIEFDIDNAAFIAEDETYNWGTVADTITVVSDRIRDGYLSANVYDPNGNTVGKYSVD